jgi:hypothetical protein
MSSVARHVAHLARRGGHYAKLGAVTQRPLDHSEAINRQHDRCNEADQRYADADSSNRF